MDTERSAGQCDSCGKVSSELTSSSYEDNGVADGEFCPACMGHDMCKCGHSEFAHGPRCEIAGCGCKEFR